jgi:septal ring factor EnvC (AmiA/AmiB activator)
MNREQIKNSILEYDNVNQELKSLQTKTKHLKEQKNEIGENIKEFMATNNLEVCRIESMDTNIKKIKYVERENKEQLSMKLLKAYITDFFDVIDNVKFLQLTSDEKKTALFEFLETKRKTKKHATISIL